MKKSARIGLMAVVMFAGSPCLKSSAAAQNEQLEAGKSIERKLAPGQTQDYGVNLSAGQAIHIVIEQSATDTLAAFFDPAGRQLLEARSHSRRHGANRLWIVAETDGDYQLRIKSHPSITTSGKYRIIVEAIRAAEPADRHRAAAQQLFARADERSRTPDVQVGRNAIELFERSLEHWRAAGDREMEAITLAKIGFAHGDVHDRINGLNVCRQALPLLRRTSHQWMLAGLLNWLGRFENMAGERPKAREYLLEAIALSRDLQDRDLEAEATNRLGISYSDSGEFERARERYLKTIELARAVGNQFLEATALNNLGDDYHTLGDPDQARAYLEQALPVSQTGDDRTLEALINCNLAEAYLLMGEAATAIPYARRGVELGKAIGFAQAERLGLMNLGEITFSRGEYAAAAAYFNEALALARQTGSRYVKILSMLYLARTYRVLGRSAEADGPLNEALEQSRKIGIPLFESYALDEMARLERERGRLEAAQSLIEQSLRITEAVRGGVLVQESRTTFSATLRDSYDLYIDVLMQRHRADPAGGFAVSALRASEQARAQSLIEMLAEARADGRFGVAPEMLKRERDLRREISAATEQRLNLGSSPENQARIVEVEKAFSALKDELRDLEARIRRSKPGYEALVRPRPRPFALAEIQARVLDERTMLLEYALGERRSYLWAVTRDSFVSYELPGRTEIEKLARQLLERLKAKPASRDGSGSRSVRKASLALSRVILKPVAPRLRGKRLLIVSDGALHYIPFGALPLPVTGEPLIAAHEVVMSPSAMTLDALRQGTASRASVPGTVAVLADPVFGRYDERATSPLPAPSQQQTPSKPQSSRKRRGAIAAGPTSMSRRTSAPEGFERAIKTGQRAGPGEALLLPRLPFSKIEADAIAAIVPKDQLLLATGFQANRQLATSAQLGQYRIVHYATHGIFNTQRPELSGLFFSTIDENGDTRNGFVGIGEIYNLKLPADLIVLSACDTALGRQIRGEGMVGMTRGFMYGGAQRVLASLWKVNDASTAELMKRFYQGMLGQRKLPPGAALREAQVSMWKEKKWRSPYYWAAFVLQGEW